MSPDGMTWEPPDPRRRIMWHDGIVYKVQDGWMVTEWHSEDLAFEHACLVRRA